MRHCEEPKATWQSLSLYHRTMGLPRRSLRSFLAMTFIFAPFRMTLEYQSYPHFTHLLRS